MFLKRGSSWLAKAATTDSYTSMSTVGRHVSDGACRIPRETRAILNIRAQHNAHNTDDKKYACQTRHAWRSGAFSSYFPSESPRSAERERLAALALPLSRERLSRLRSLERSLSLSMSTSPSLSSRSSALLSFSFSLS